MCGIEIRFRTRNQQVSEALSQFHVKNYLEVFWSPHISPADDYQFDSKYVSIVLYCWETQATYSHRPSLWLPIRISAIQCKYQKYHTQQYNTLNCWEIAANYAPVICCYLSFEHDAELTPFPHKPIQCARVQNTLTEIRDWFRDYKIPDGKPPNKFGLGNKPANKVWESFTPSANIIAQETYNQQQNRIPSYSGFLQSQAMKSYPSTQWDFCRSWFPVIFDGLFCIQYQQFLSTVLHAQW